MTGPGVLLGALLLLDASLSPSAPPACGGPRVLVAITGKGPLKQHYERRVAGLALRRIGIATLCVARAGRLDYDDQSLTS